MAATQEELQKRFETDRGFRDLVAKYGMPQPVVGLVGQDCSTLPPGSICMETNCTAGKKLVLLCNDSKGCTESKEIDC